MRVEDFNDLFMKELNSWQKDYFPHLKKDRNNNTDFMLYTINSGDNLYSIARKFNIDVKKIKKINNYQDGDVYQPGDKIKLPTKTHIVKKGQGMMAVLRENGMDTKERSDDFELFLDSNNLDYDSVIHLDDKLLVLDKSMSDENTSENETSKLLNDDFGYYYTLEGVFIKTGSKATDSGKVYVLQNQKDNNPNILLLNGNPIKHIDFLQLAGVAYNEEGDNIARKVIIGVMLNRLNKQSYFGKTINEVLGKIAGNNVGATHQDRLNSTTFRRYAIFFKETLTSRNGNFDFKNSIESAIHILNGGKDYSNGALYWHGIDFFTPERQDFQGNTIKNDAYWNEYLPKGFRWDNNGVFMGNFNNQKNKNWEKLGSQSKDYQYIGVATHGNSIYMVHIND
jgi:LysM repeat protein